MPQRRSSQLKPLITLLVFLGVWWIAPTVVKSFARVSFYEFQAPILALNSHLTDLQTYWSIRPTSKKELIEQNVELRRLMASFEVARQRQKAQEDIIAGLEAVLRLPAEPTFRYEVARVTKRELNAWWHQIIIRKGENYSIPVGAAVIYEGGVVGRVREVHAYTSVVELASSPGFRMAAMIEGEDRPVTFQGGFNPPFSPPLGEVLNVPPSLNASPSEPLTLLSSPLGGVFPQGLRIGEITSLEAGFDGFFQQGIVRLPGELSALREVAVAIPLTEEAGPAEGAAP